MKKLSVILLMMMVAAMYGAKAAHCGSLSAGEHPAPASGPDSTDDGDGGNDQNQGGPDGYDDDGGCGGEGDTADDPGPDSTDDGDSF